MKPKLVLIAGILSMAVLAAALGYGLSSICSYCGQGLAILWGIAIALFPILWALRQGYRSNWEYLDQCCSDDHEYFWEEKEELVAWHGDIPIIERVKVKRCCKCDHQEVEESPAFSRYERP